MEPVTLTVVSAAYDPWGNINVVFEGQKPDTVIAIPPDEMNKDYIAIQKWVAEGGEILAYVPPPAADPAPTMEELMARIAALEAGAAPARKK